MYFRSRYYVILQQCVNSILWPQISGVQVVDKGFQIAAAQATADPDMPKCVKRSIAGALEVVKPDVRNALDARCVL